MAHRITRIAGAILLGLAWFMTSMGASIALMLVNARLAPDVPWFPLPVFLLVIGSSLWAERRWRIGLTHPAGVAWRRIYLLALTTTVFGICVAVLQGAAFDMTRVAETGPPGTGPWFRFAFAFAMPLVAAVLAEVAFRGIIQSRLHALLAPVPAIVLVAAVNTAAHRWNPDLAAQWLGYFVILLGCGYVRWLGGSVLPPLAAHFWQNFVLAAATWYGGPFEQGALSATALAAIAVTGAVALALTIVVGRGTAAYASGSAAGPVLAGAKDSRNAR